MPSKTLSGARTIMKTEASLRSIYWLSSSGVIIFVCWRKVQEFSIFLSILTRIDWPQLQSRGSTSHLNSMINGVRENFNLLLTYGWRWVTSPTTLNRPQLNCRFIHWWKLRNICEVIRICAIFYCRDSILTNHVWIELREKWNCSCGTPFGNCWGLAITPP